MKKAILFWVLLACSTTLFAQWSIVASGFPSVYLNDITASPTHLIAVGTKSSSAGFEPHIFIGNAEGTQWDTINVLPKGYFFKTVAFKDKDTGFIGGYGNVSIWLQTTDGGATWKYYNVDGGNRGITAMTFLNDKLGFACGYGATQFFSGNVYKTIDGGHTWEPQSDPMDSLPMDGMQMINEQFGYAWGGTFGAKKLLKTIDYGATWTHYYTHNTAPGGMYWWNVNEGILVDTKGGIYKTSDAGNTWTAKNSGVTTGLTSVLFLDKKTGFATGTYGVILKTTDGGETWTKQPGIPSKIFYKAAYLGNRVYAVGEDGLIMRSEVITGIETFEPIKDQPILFPNPSSGLIHITHHLSKEPLIVTIADTQGRVVKRINYTPDGIDVSDLPSGMYQVTLSSNGYQSTHKWVLNH